MRPYYDKNMDGEFENRISENVPVMTISAYGSVYTGPAPKISYSIDVGFYLAMDLDKAWCVFKIKPEKTKLSWMGGYITGSAENTTAAWPDWEDSLFLMTENGLVKV